MNKELKKVIEEKLDNIIMKYGLEEEPEKSYSKLVNELYPKSISENYNKSYEALTKITNDFGEFPTIAEWNKYAKENNYLNHISLQYVAKLDWHKLRRKVKKEITAIKNK